MNPELDTASATPSPSRPPPMPARAPPPFAPPRGGGSGGPPALPFLPPREAEGPPPRVTPRDSRVSVSLVTQESPAEPEEEAEEEAEDVPARYSPAKVRRAPPPRPRTRAGTPAGGPGRVCSPGA